MVSIEGLNKAEVFAALYNATEPKGMGINAYDPTPLTITEAAEILKEKTEFDYYKGRAIKVDLTSDLSFEECHFDRNYGKGAAQRIIDNIRVRKSEK